MATQTHVNLSGGAASLSLGGPERLNLWQRFASIMPLIALVVGLIAVNSMLNDERANDIAEVDSALLIDDLPPVEGSAAKQKVPPTPNTLTTRAAFNRRKQVTRVGVAGRCKKVIG
jgi:Protein of unknown function (DUF3619)